MMREVAGLLCWIVGSKCLLRATIWLKPETQRYLVTRVFDTLDEGTIEKLEGYIKRRRDRKLAAFIRAMGEGATR